MSIKPIIKPRRNSRMDRGSILKRLYGEYCMAKSMENITKELSAKAYTYNIELYGKVRSAVERFFGWRNHSGG
jgi:hypothetical protein